MSFRNEPMIEAILFDNDGVLVDTEPLYFRASQEVMAEAGVALSEEEFAEYSLTRGCSVFDLAVERGTAPAEVAGLRARRDAIYASFLEGGVAPIDGVVECLEQLRGGPPLAVVTSSAPDHFEIIHRRTGLLRFFEFALTSADYVRHKPHPEPYLKAAARLGVDPRRCLVVEDTPRGLRSAKAAGMMCLAIPRGLSLIGDFAGADALLADLREALGFVQCFGRGNPEQRGILGSE